MRQRVLELLRRHGRTTTSFQVLEPGLEYWFDDSNEACVAYARCGRARVAAGEPISSDSAQEEVVRQFTADCEKHGLRARFFATESEPPTTSGLAAMPVGEQPEWRPSEWPDTVARVPSLREQLRRARAKGVTIRALSPAELEPQGKTRMAIDSLVARWRDSRSMAPMAFLVSLDLFNNSDERRFFVAERDQELVGILVAVPIFARNGWFFEDVLRDPAAPNGTIELLFDHAMRAAATEDIEHVTFGLAPLASTNSVWLRRIRDNTRWLYDFDGLQSFKNKLRPTTWRPVYLWYPERERGVMATVDVLRAFAGGSLVRFAARMLVHWAPAIAWLLALLLIPWTALLIAAPGGWFPSETIKAAWIGYDCLLFGGLVALALRWRYGLAVAMCAATATDFALGCWQAITFNLASVNNAGAMLAVITALAAPLFATALLWMARNRAHLYHQPS